MTFMDEQERLELLDLTDVFFMAKIMHEAGIPMKLVDHHNTTGADMFLTCLLYAQEVYPYIRVRNAEKEDEYVLIVTVTLPRSLKSYYKVFKEELQRILYTADLYYGEMESEWHYNEMHLHIEWYVYFHDVLRSFIRVLQQMKAREVAA